MSASNESGDNTAYKPKLGIYIVLMPLYITHKTYVAYFDSTSDLQSLAPIVCITLVITNI